MVFHPAGTQVYVLSWVDHHDEAYRWAERRQFVVHPSTGALQVVSAESAEASPVVSAQAAAKGLFAEIKDKHLLRLGVPEQLIPLVRSITTDVELEAVEKQLPQEAYESLFMLAAGFSLDEVFAEMEKPEEVAPVDQKDFAGALQNEDSKRRFFVIEEAKDLAEVLNAPLEQWRIFLHPKQRRLVSMKANGPVRVLGGAGTGKTVVAMHRARYLAEEVFNKKEDRILFTTFTRNLATDIQDNLRKLCSVEALSRIDVVNLDAWVANFLRGHGYRHQVVFDEDENEAWAFALNLAPADVGLTPNFYRSEWEQVIQAQNITDAEQYLKASRIGRGTRLSRNVKKRIWPVFQEYRAQLNEQGKKEYIDLLRDARGLIQSKGISLPYRSVIVDEAQDMSAEAFRLMRAIIPEGSNDLFIVGDGHQRIYRHKASLGQCGINIKGRGKKLKINYRTTDEIRRFAVHLLEGREIDDLDGGQDQQKGYMSLTHGQAPAVHSFAGFADEIAFLRGYIGDLQKEGTPLESICVVTRTKRLLEGYVNQFQEAGFGTYEIKRNAAEQRDKPGLRLATMHRVKGLEFEHVIVAAANKGILPLEAAVDDAEDAIARRNAETGERSLLYVALTRARRSAIITGYGQLTTLIAPN
ncbi:MAG: UvrD-helicase domain-containing protein [Acidobacteriota bacterium]|nr:UvrD-helicase domain-containing protein [Acidobacteriota bacterium]